MKLPALTIVVIAGLDQVKPGHDSLDPVLAR
jgi:hypothetical protein